MNIVNIDKIKEIILSKFKLNKEKSNRIVKTNNKVKEALKEIEEKRNYAWDLEIETRNKSNLNKEALFYRGKVITFGDLFEKRDCVAKALKQAGVKKGDVIAMCMSNTPEFIYSLMAISEVGAEATIFGEGFDKKYIEEILKGCTDKVFFATDKKYEKIKDILRNKQFNHKVISSLTDSLPNGIDPYYELDRDFYDFSNRIPSLKREDKNIRSFKEFVNFGKDYSGPIRETVTLDDDFLRSFTSGSTRKGLPKQIVHPHRSLITMTRFHDADLSGLPAMNNVRMLAHIPTYSNTDVITSISDPLSQGCSVALEPIYDIRFHNRSLVINKPNAIPSTTSFLIHSAKTFEKEFPNEKMEQAYIVIAVGEPTSKGEERFINKWLKSVKAGTKRVPFPLSPVTLSLGGGDCEHGGIYFTLFHALRQKVSLSKETYGLTPFKCVEEVILDRNGNHITDGSVGRLGAIGPTTMKRYDGNEEATNKFFIKDVNGKVYGDTKAWASKNKKGNTIMHGRMGSEFHLSTGEEIAPYVISESVQEDYLNVLSCEVINTKTEEGVEIPVVHIELQPDAKDIMSVVLMNAKEKLDSLLPRELSDKVVFRFHSNEDEFQITGSGKRSLNALEEEGLTEKCFKPERIDGEIYFVNYKTVFTDIDKKLVLD